MNVKKTHIIKQIRRNCYLVIVGQALVLSIFLSQSTVRAQTFDSTSDGSDGALDFSTVPPGTTIVFDPTSFTPPLDTDGDNIFHFTTITIPSEVTIRLPANALTGIR